MRLSCLLLLAFSLVALHPHPTAATIVRRDGADTASAAASSVLETSTEPASSTTSGASSTRSSDAASSTPASAAATTVAAGNTAAATTTSELTATSDGGATNTAAAIYSGHGLPLQPRVTPAIGIAGVILLVTGVVYALIGVKTKTIPFSSAYLVALAITVLVEYVMSPPVSNAVQGAFLVAAIVPGAIAGGVAIVFHDLTRGFGCLLGGFCIAMWFLVLKAGGLIGSSAGRAIFIGVMCVVGWALSFSSFTKDAGLIGCTSFAGATITVLGIDCFSRAGLKEFWLYIWDLNDDTFPLFTDTYPITRGIRVEIACIIVITLVGIASQMRLWKVVKDQRDKKALEHQRQLEERERIDEEAGMKILKDTDRELSRWEAQYGDKSVAMEQSDSAIGYSADNARTGAVSVKEVGRSESDDSIELDDMRRSGDGSDVHLVSRRTSRAREDEIRRIDAQGNPLPARGLANQQDSMNTRQSTDRTAYDGNRTPASTRLAPPPPPLPVVPLPFVVPTGDDSNCEIEGQESVASIPDQFHEMEYGTGRLSAMSSGNRISNIRNSNATSEEALLRISRPGIEDDGASSFSVAATLDGLNDGKHSLSALSRPGTPFSALIEPNETEYKGSADLPDGTEDSAAAAGKTTPETSEDAQRDVEKNRQQTLLELSEPQSRSPSTDPEANADNGKRASLKDVRRSGTSTNRGEAGPGDKQTRSRKSTNPSEITHSVVGSLSDHLPEKISPAMQIYRANEWAKHLSLADRPELESIPEPSSPGIRVDTSFRRAADTRPKSPTSPTGTRPERVSRDASQLSSADAPRRSQPVRSASSQSKNAPSPDAPTTVSRNPSSATPALPAANPPSNLQRSSSASSVPTASRPGSTLGPSNPRNFRSSSSPLATLIAEETLVESPTEETEEEVLMSAKHAPSPMPTNTLLSKRENLMRDKMSTISFNSPYALAGNAAARTPSESGSLRDSPSDERDPDDMSLKERKKMLEQRKRSMQGTRQSSQPQQRQGSRPLASPSPTEQTQAFNSHQPKRSPGFDHSRQEDTMARWREGIKELKKPVQQVTPDEGRRSAMINESRQKHMKQQQQEMAAQRRASQMDTMMRNSHMQDLHAQHLRRMQAAANKHA